jgi:LemA protein
MAENYPQLRANENFLSLQAELANTEDRIQASRRFYNANVRDYNARTRTFPSRLVASMFHFAEEDFFQVEPALREAVSDAPEVTFASDRAGGAAAQE